MSNKPMLGADRNIIEDTPERLSKGAMSLGTGCGKCSRCLAEIKPAAQHQGEPVAWVFADSVGGIRWRPQALGSLLDGTALYAQPSEPLPPHSLLQEVLKGWEESCYGDPPVRMAQAIKAVREHLAQAERLAPLAVEAAKAFAKGFNTLESGGGKYRISMQFQSLEDA